MDVGFYYMANALGRLIGTVLSGVIYQQFGLLMCLCTALIFTLLANYFVKKVV
jgi:predicted MFS family arabinose efflux permease